MESIKVFLSSDHKECDELFADVENAIVNSDWDNARIVFGDMKKHFLRHFDMEESVFFPEFETSSGMSCGPTQVMRMEHEQMRQAIVKLEMALESKNKEQALGICDTFNILVQQHNSKEESILYTMADNVFGAKSKDIVHRMSEVA